MRTPDFWKRRSFVARLLLPFSKIYAYFSFEHQKRQRKTMYNSRLKVVCVGNIVAGGSGKTPVAIEIAKILKDKGKKVVFLSRGYGGKLDNTVVDCRKHDYSDVGDEPLLLAAVAPVVIARNRGSGAMIAERMGAEYLIMDDGFQNQTLHKDISLLVFDGGIGIGNGYTLPAGPLRDDVDTALKRADFAIISGRDMSGIGKLLSGRIKILNGSVYPSVGKQIENGRWVAFAGIGRPEKFRETLIDLKIDLADFRSYPDHYPYTDADIKGILALAEKFSAKVITTAKDMVKIPAMYRNQIESLPIDFHFDSGCDELVSRLLS